MFTHLNVHSHYSRMSGTASQPALLTAARNQGMNHLALTETNGLWGFIRFVQHARAAEIKRINPHKPLVSVNARWFIPWLRAAVSSAGWEAVPDIRE
jgi:DNA polymerase III alpha subunit